MRGRKPQPTAIRRADGNPGKRGYNHAEPQPPNDLPDCPPHLSEVARAEWDRVAGTLHEIGVLTTIDRAALAAYYQAYGRWVEAEENMKKTPSMLKTPSGYVQPSLFFHSREIGRRTHCRARHREAWSLPLAPVVRRA